MEASVGENSSWDEAVRPSFDQEMDVLAFELWQQGSRQDVAVPDEVLEDEDVLFAHSSCL